MDLTLRQQIEKMTHGDHACLLYRTFREQMAAVVPYIKDGLKRGECCLYVADNRITTQILDVLAKAGVDVIAEQESGALCVFTKRETYLRTGRFDPEAMLSLLRTTLRRKLAAGFSGLRAAGEMTWALEQRPSCDRLVPYERSCDAFIPTDRMLGLCQYNANLFPRSVLRDVVRAHAHVIADGHVASSRERSAPGGLSNHFREFQRDRLLRQ